MKSPKAITTDIIKFGEQLSQGEEFMFVSSKPSLSANPLECYETVQKRVAQKGGKRVLGWLLFDWPNVFLTAELHAVWEQPNGKLLDIAVHEERMARILFIPDPNAKVPKIQEPNRFYPLGNDPLIEMCIGLEQATHQASNPTSPYLELTPEYMKCQGNLINTRQLLNRKYGDPPGKSPF